MAALTPTPEAVANKLPELREQFNAKLGENVSKGLYDQRDVHRFEKDDAYAKCFLRTLKSKGDVPKALEVMDNAFRFRKEYNLWDLNFDDFPREFQEKKSAIYYKGKTKDGFPILYMLMKDSGAKNDDEKTWLKKFIAFNFEHHHRTNPEQMVVVLLDMTGCGITNLQSDLFKYVTMCFTTYFPAYLAFMINYHMPTVVSAAWQVVSVFLKEDQKGKLLMCGKKDIKKYLDDDQLWDHMK